MKAPALISRGSRPPLWREARLGFEAAALARDPVLRGHGLPEGRGRPALLIPGFMAGDGSLALMSNWLRRSGFRTQKAGMRANVGCAGTGLAGLEQRLERLVSEQGKRAVVIGQSRGGSQAKVLAARRPDLICGVVTLGSPHVEAVSRLGSLGAPGLFKRDCLDGECCASFWKSLGAPLAPEVGFVAVYSRSDGIVDWRACLDPHADQHVEIGASHCGMAVSPAAWRAVAEALERFARSESRRSKPVQRLRRVA